MTFGEKLKQARAEAGWSQEELASRIGVSRAAVAKWETDKGLPDIENLKAIAKMLDISIDVLLDESTPTDFTVTREPLDLAGASGFIQKAKRKDALVKERFANFQVCSLTATKNLSFGEKMRDDALTLFTAFLPEIGSFDSGTDIVKAFENRNNAFYLAENEGKQYFIIASDEQMEIRQLTQRITGRKFELGDWKLTRGKTL